MKVIGFDSWTGGWRNFERVALACAQRGISFHVCHIGSWGSDPDRVHTEELGKVRYKDIRAYSTATLPGILEAERPDAVLFLSTDTFAHRAFNRLCRHEGIPTVHLYHGLVSVQEVGATTPAYKVNPLAQLRFVLERVPKALRHTWPSYAASLVKTRARLGDWLRFVSDIFVLASGRWPYKAAPDARTDRCCVYVEADVGHAVHRYGFSPNQVLPVGNPDLARFSLSRSDIGLHLSQRTNGPEVMYIDTGLIYTGCVFESPKQYIEHLKTTRDVLARAGQRMLLKPHPHHAHSGMLDTFRSEGIDLCPDVEFIERLRRASAAIVEPSSLSIVPAILGMPVFLAQYGRLSGQPFGAVLTSYPRHAMLTNVSALPTLQEGLRRSRNEAAVREWISKNIGPMPASDMPTRVVDVIVDTIRSTQKLEKRP